jgi:hypothetical protein
MLAGEVQLDLMGRRRFDGIAEINNKYFHNYKQKQDWYLRLGIAEGQLAILVYDPQNLSSQPDYFMLIA